MNVETKQLIEFAGIFAVILSLIFVGYEIRQSDAIARAETRQALAEKSMELYITRSTNIDLNRQYAEFLAEPGQETECNGKFSEACPLILAGLRHLENVFLQVEEGVIDESVFSSYGYIGPIWTIPRVQALWKEWSAIFNPMFVSSFNQANGIE